MKAILAPSRVLLALILKCRQKSAWEPGAAHKDYLPFRVYLTSLTGPSLGSTVSHVV